MVTNRLQRKLFVEFLRVPSFDHYRSLHDLPAYVQNANTTMYADDTSLDKAIQTSQQLKKELFPAFSKVCKWLEMNKISLNTVKIGFMIIGTLQHLNQLDKSPESTPYIIMIDGGK